ncbi:hypothetical protein F4811DRAFT_517394 [Daldinia bambusicola]|nr:hypothetical protein F4811DRAFT_517394 [Daldinia bambusicola]
MAHGDPVLHRIYILEILVLLVEYLAHWVCGCCSCVLHLLFQQNGTSRWAICRRRIGHVATRTKLRIGTSKKLGGRGGCCLL